MSADIPDQYLVSILAVELMCLGGLFFAIRMLTREVQDATKAIEKLEKTLNELEDP